MLSHGSGAKISQQGWCEFIGSQPSAPNLDYCRKYGLKYVLLFQVFYKKRKGVSNNERTVIRKRAREHPGKQTELINWFLQEYGHKLEQDQVSQILSSKYNYIENIDKKKDK